MEMSEKQINAWVRWSGVALMVALIGEVVSQRALFADGVNFLLQITRHQEFSHWDFPRQFVHYISQWPAIAAMHLGVHNLQAIAWLYGLGLFAVHPLTLLACWLLTPAKQRGYLLFVIFGLAYTALNSSLFIISESHWAAGLFFVLLYFLLFAQHNTSFPRQLGACLAAVLSLRAYESFAVLGPFLTGLAFLRALQLARTQPGTRLRLTLLVTAVCGMASAGIGAYFMLFSDRSVQKVGLSRIAGDLVHDPNAMLSTGLLWLFLVYALVPRAGSKARTYAALGCLAAIALGVGLGLMPLFHAAFLPTTLHYPARVLNIIVPVALAAVMVWRHHTGHLFITPYAVLPLCLMLVWNTTWQGVVSWQWHTYTQQVTRAVEQSPTPVVDLFATEMRSSPFNWGWTLPSLSLVVAGMQDGEVRSLLVDDPHPAFQPFDPTIRSQWPDLQAFGVTYSRIP